MMGYGTPEQADGRSWKNRGSRNCHRYLKNALNRVRRRMAKQDPEGVPNKRRYRGWET